MVTVVAIARERSRQRSQKGHHPGAIRRNTGAMRALSAAVHGARIAIRVPGRNRKTCSNQTAGQTPQRGYWSNINASVSRQPCMRSRPSTRAPWPCSLPVSLLAASSPATPSTRPASAPSAGSRAPCVAADGGGGGGRDVTGAAAARRKPHYARHPRTTGHTPEPRHPSDGSPTLRSEPGAASKPALQAGRDCKRAGWRRKV